MTSEPAAKLLWDARQAAEGIARITTGKTFADYQSDEILRWAVERQFTVVGEAFSALRRIDPVLADSIPDAARIVAFRKVLSHGYASVDDRLVWGVLERDLDMLRSTLSGLLDRGSDPAT